jgi:hypothetical protein
MKWEKDYQTTALKRGTKMRSRIRGRDAARAAVATTERLPVTLQATDLVGPSQPMPEVVQHRKPPRVRKRPAETGRVSQPSQCGARTRSGAPCKSAPVTGRRRCRMHGGADGSGAPKGARNGNYKHGRYTKEVAATRSWLREAIHTLRELKRHP